MSGFSPAWLDLREPFDLVARNRKVVAACADHFRARDSVTVVDLGAGTGASIRAVADLLPLRQSWRLIDHDGANLAAAYDRLASWSDSASQRGDAFELTRGRRRIAVSIHRGDLAADLEAHCPSADLITLSALLDLTSAAWIGRLADVAAARRASVLATLNFDGRIACAPAHPLDGAIAPAFANHQRRDKGFGTAAGPDANDSAVQALTERGFNVTSGDSPWIASAVGPFRAALVDGIVAAVNDLATVPAAEVNEWASAARGGSPRLMIGHRDFFARL